LLTYPPGAETRALAAEQTSHPPRAATELFESSLRGLLEDGFRVALAILRDPREAEDALQDASLDAWRNHHRFRGEAGALRSWFLAIVANRCRSRFRQSWWRRGRPVGADPSLDRIEGRRHEAVVELRADLAVALGRLTWNQRAVLCLYYQLDLPHEEVARVLGIRVGAVKSRIHRATRALRDAIKEQN
jgi:RNA polymerase sigma-70 factor (ECF subfamily)